MEGKFQVPDLKDPFLREPSSYLLPKILKSSASISMATDARNHDPIQKLLTSMGPGDKVKLLGEVEAILDSELGAGMAALENGGDGAADVPEGGKRRRPDFGLKRARFSLLPDVSKPVPQVDPKAILDRLEDPDEYFAAYERMEFANKEMKRLKGESELEPNQNQQLNIARVRRRALDIGRKSTYKHIYPKFASDAENLLPSQKSAVAPVATQLSPKLPIKEVDISRERVNSVAEDASNLMREANNNSGISKDDESFADERAENMLGELLIAGRDLDENQTLNMLQDCLNMKPLDLEKLNLPDLDSVPIVDLKASEEVFWRSRKSISTSQPTDGPGNTGNMLLKDQQSVKGSQILLTPSRINKEVVLPSSNSDKNDTSSLRRNIDSILLARNKNRLTFSDKSQISHARMTKDANSPLSNRTKFDLRSFSPNNYPNPVNLEKGFDAVELHTSKEVNNGNIIGKSYSKQGAEEVSSGLVDISFHMDNGETDVGNSDIHNSRTQDDMDANHNKESVTDKSRFGLEIRMEGTAYATRNQIDDSFSLGDMHVDKNSEKSYGGRIADGSTNDEFQRNDKVQEESVSLEPITSREGHSVGTSDGSLDLSEQLTTLDMNLASEGNLDISNILTEQNVKEQTRDVSGKESKAKGRSQRRHKKGPQSKKRALAVKLAAILDTSPTVAENLESSNVLREQEPARIESGIALNTKAHPQRQRKIVPKGHIAEKLATTLDTNPTVEENLQSSNVLWEQEPARVESGLAVKTKAHPQRQRKIVPKRHSLAGAGSSWQAGLRRSTRIRREPLKWWKGERLLYGRIHESLATVIGVKYSKNDNDKNPEFGVESFVSDTYSDLVNLAACH